MSPIPQLRVLYAEDDPDTRELTCLILEADGFEIICPDSLREFVRMAKAERFDVFMLDTWMPEISGIDLCKIIREFDPQTPIIFYSAAAYDHDRKQALECGAQAYVTKPARFEELASTLRSAAKASPVQLVSTAHPTL